MHLLVLNLSINAIIVHIKHLRQTILSGKIGDNVLRMMKMMIVAALMLATNKNIFL